VVCAIRVSSARGDRGEGDLVVRLLATQRHPVATRDDGWAPTRPHGAEGLEGLVDHREDLLRLLVGSQCKSTFVATANGFRIE